MIRSLVDTAKRAVLTDGRHSLSFWDYLNASPQSRSEYTHASEDSFRELSQALNLLVTTCYADHQMCIERLPLLKRIKHFILPKGLGTLDQLRAKIELKYPAKRLRLRVGSHARLDTCLVLPEVLNETLEARSARLEELERFVHQRGLLDHRIDRQPEDSSPLTSESDECPSLLGHPLAVICQPNAGYYEMAGEEPRMLELFHKQGYSTMLWNYRGFGHSSGSASMELIVRDLRALIGFLRRHLAPAKVVVYGRSLGGHGAKGCHDLVDLMIVDRSFSSISLVPRIMMGAKIQKIFDLVMDNYSLNVRETLESEGKKVLLYDPNVRFTHTER